MKFYCITLFPDHLTALMEVGVIGSAIKKEFIQIETINPRTFTDDIHHTVDDRPYGGGDGMVMMAEPLLKCVDFVRQRGASGPCVFLSPQGRRWSDPLARQLVKNKDIILISGRYAGVDQRVIESVVDHEISIGDYVLSGGEIPMAIVVETMSRFVPGVLGNHLSSHHESFADGLLECPQFTRPAEFRGLRVPQFLLSGCHGEIKKIREAVAVIRTRHLRPDLPVDSTIYLQAVEVVKRLSPQDQAQLGLKPEWMSQ